MGAVTPQSARRAAGLTQEALADRLGVDRGTVGRWERGLQTPHPWQRPALGDALGLLPDDLDALLSCARPSTELELSERGRPDPMATSNSEDGRSPTQTELATKDIVRASVPRLRRALDMLDLPDDGPVRSGRDLARDVIRLNEHRLDARYVDIVRAAPSLITELARASQQAMDEERRLAAQLMTLALRAADGVAFKFGSTLLRTHRAAPDALVDLAAWAGAH